MKIIASLFKKHKVIGIDCTKIIYGGGAIHCLTMQDRLVNKGLAGLQSLQLEDFLCLLMASHGTWENLKSKEKNIVLDVFQFP